jgi:DMSO reductase family type II enzyme heme b subunit
MRGKFFQAVLVLLVAFAVFKFAIRPPMPFSLLSLYMAITLLAVLLYVSSDSDSWRAFVGPIWATLTEPGRRPIRIAFGILLPALVGYYAYSQASAKPEAPLELRAIHPAPPATVSFRGKAIDLQAADTPVRKDLVQNPQNRAKHLAAGGAIYIRNCMYCHGDALDGRGHFAHGFNPVPANFIDPGTIAQLSEGYLFWRIAKGGPGLPKESTPWNSAMPAWEDRLTEEEIWQVIYYLYETTGYPPRQMEGGPAPPPPTPRATGGKELYAEKCALCHGDSGKGDGPAAELLDPRPRDFTAGKYKIRSTEGELPSDDDLFRVISEGMPGTSMPAWREVPEAGRRALVAHLRQFAPDAFRDAKPSAAGLPKDPGSSDASIKRGRTLFQELLECNKCHGQAGRGDPAPGSDLKDDWGHPIRPANLTKVWTFRGGAERREIALRLWTGLKGTPMPAFKGSVEDYKEYLKQEAKEKKDDRLVKEWQDASIWDVVNYVRSLGPERPGWATLLTVRPVTGEVPSDPNAKFWLDWPGASFPLVGQVIVDPRNFNPTVDLITVRAVHTPEEVVFHLTWDDPTASDPSKGAQKPDMVALQFPGGGQGGERPYFLMGEAARPVYLLTWQAGAGFGEATAAGIGKLTPATGEGVQTRGEVVYEAGQYRATMRRPLRTPDQADFAFPAAQFFPVAFWAWDGGAGEEGARAAVSAWYYGRLEAPPSKRQFVIPPLAVLGTVILEVGLSRWARRRRDSAASR